MGRDLPPLDAGDFDAFLTEVHPGHSGAFPWQHDLLAQAIDGVWPDVLDVPTGLGKTVVIDIAVFALAIQADRSPRERTARTRLFVVVDRRLVVDQITEHAEKLADVLDHPPAGGICQRVRERLLSLMVSDHPDPFGRVTDPEATARPLVVTRMRGGTTWDSRWLERPDQPAVTVGTVDQLGSRMFFRGYGVSDASLPIDAALVGTDSLVVLDEAHLSQAARTSLETALDVDQLAPDHPLAHRPTHLMEMSATPRTHPDRWMFEFDMPAHLAHPECQRRLEAAKPVALWDIVDIPANHLRATGRLASVLAHAAELAAPLAPRETPECAPVLAVVANTVGTARRTYTLLRSKGADVVLLTGRHREVDRAWLSREVMDQAKAPSPDQPRANPLFVVATQTIEVGVDLDVACLITEAAPIDALAQRFGRLDRRGKLTDTGSPAFAVVVHAPSLGDIVYRPPTTKAGPGNKTRAPVTATWDLLLDTAQAPPTQVKGKRLPARIDTTGELDLSPLHLRELLQDLLQSNGQHHDVYSPCLDPPTLTPDQLQAWAHTSPKPRSDVGIEPFLHGRDRTSPTATAPVQVFWRSDVATIPADSHDKTKAEFEQQARTSVTALRPHDSEIVDVPLSDVRRWLNQTPSDLIADIEATPAPDTKTDSTPPTKQTRFGVTRLTRTYPQLPRRQRGVAVFDASIVTAPDQVRPGDLLLCAADMGGLDRFGWAPDDQRPVIDVADLCPRRSGPRVRLAPAIAGQYIPQQAKNLDLPDIEASLRQLDNAYAAGARGTTLHPQVTGALATYANLLETLEATYAQTPDDRNWTATHAARDLARTLRQIAADPHKPVQHQPRIWTVATKPTTSTARVATEERADEDDSTSLITPNHTTVPTLQDHLQNVGTRAALLAERIGLPPEHATAIQLAADAHDLGKLHPRFQNMLQGSHEPLWPGATQPIAKSGQSHDQWRRSARRAGWPTGLRHEALSTALLDNYTTTIRNNSGDDPYATIDSHLVRHLIGSHHGFARAIYPPTRHLNGIDNETKGQHHGIPVHLSSIETAKAAQDWAHPAQFNALLERYGTLGLAFLETIVRLADMNCSEAGL